MAPPSRLSALRISASLSFSAAFFLFSTFLSALSSNVRGVGRVGPVFVPTRVGWVGVEWVG
jgi:hypothetical protein